MLSIGIAQSVHCLEKETTCGKHNEEAEVHIYTNQVNDSKK